MEGNEKPVKGLELSRRYFEAYGKPMLEEKFPELLPYLAAGLCGSGSECFGFDDEVSRDHDFEPGFIIFLPDEETVDRRAEFRLERAYAALPKEFMGFERQRLQPVGGARHGVVRTADFFRARTGSPDGALTAEEWLRLPDYALAEAVNGEIYFDAYGEVGRIREALGYFPEDIRRKRLAGNLLLMAQSGQYNYTRCIRHGEEGAAQLAVFTFVKSAMAAAFLLNRVYMPYYKWSFRAMRSLPILSIDAELLEYLITSGNDEETREEKYAVIESVAGDYAEALKEEGITEAVCTDLEKHAYSVNDGIQDGSLRNLNVLAAVGEDL